MHRTVLLKDENYGLRAKKVTRITASKLKLSGFGLECIDMGSILEGDWSTDLLGDFLGVQGESPDGLGALVVVLCCFEEPLLRCFFWVLGFAVVEFGTTKNEFLNSMNPIGKNNLQSVLFEGNFVTSVVSVVDFESTYPRSMDPNITNVVNFTIYRKIKSDFGQ